MPVMRDTCGIDRSDFGRFCETRYRVLKQVPLCGDWTTTYRSLSHVSSRCLYRVSEQRCCLVTLHSGRTLCALPRTEPDARLREPIRVSVLGQERECADPTRLVGTDDPLVVCRRRSGAYTTSCADLASGTRCEVLKQATGCRCTG